MRLYYHPVSTACRPVMMLAAESGIGLDYEVVDLFTGKQRQPEFTAINPSGQVPVLEDGDFHLAEGSAILKYLADKVGSPAYPAEPRQRARVNEILDWFNTGFYRDLGYGLVYPQVLPHHKRPDERVQAGVLEWGREKTRHWLGILDQSLLGPRKPWLAGDEISIADHFAAAIVTLGEVIRLDYAGYANVVRWLGRVKARPSWKPVNEGFYAYFVAPFKDAPFVGL
jgi:glutathione S-transferase